MASFARLGSSLHGLGKLCSQSKDSLAFRHLRPKSCLTIPPGFWALKPRPRPGLPYWNLETYMHQAIPHNHPSLSQRINHQESLASPRPDGTGWPFLRASLITFHSCGKIEALRRLSFDFEIGAAISPNLASQTVIHHARYTALTCSSLTGGMSSEVGCLNHDPIRNRTSVLHH